MDTQQRRHKGPLIGMALVVTFALTLLFWLMMRTAEEGQPLTGETTEIDGRTGNPTQPEPTVPPAGEPVPPVSEPPLGDPMPPAGIPNEQPDLPPVEVPNPGPDLPPMPIPENG